MLADGPLDRLIGLLPARARQFSRFSVVGGLGFVIDAGVLQLCLSVFGMGPYLARAISYLVAATATWALHRSFTFRESNRARPHRQWVRFVTANAIGGGLNYGIYALLVASGGIFAAYPVLAVAVASIIALAFNYTASKLLVFAD